MDKREIHLYIIHGIDELELLPKTLSRLEEQPNRDQTSPPKKGEQSSRPKLISPSLKIPPAASQKSTAQKTTSHKLTF